MNINKCIYFFANLARKFGYNFHEDKDERVLQMKKVIKKIGKIEFEIEQYPDGSWTAESTNINEIITGGTSRQNISSSIKDATFTYFEIPAHLCTDQLLHGDNEPVKIRQRVYA